MSGGCSRSPEAGAERLTERAAAHPPRTTPAPTSSDLSMGGPACDTLRGAQPIPLPTSPSSPTEKRMRATARALVPLLVAAALAACGDDDGRTAPASDADRSRQRFAQLADSLDRAGSRQEADVARAVAELVRLSGRVSTLDVAFDGRSERFTAVALQVSAPPPECPQGAGCPSASELSMDLVLAWQGDGPSRVLLFAADTTGPLPLGPPRPAFADSLILAECYGDDGFCEDSLAPFGIDSILAWHFAMGAMAEPAD